MIKFFTKQILPFSGKEVQYSPFTNRYYIEYLKFSINNDLRGINDYLEEILKKFCINYNHIESNLDKFLVLLDMRSLSLGDEIKLLYNKTEVSFSLTKIRNKIVNYFKNNNIDTDLMDTIPYYMYHESETDIESDILCKSLNSYKNLTLKGRNTIYESSPACMMNKFKNKINTLQKISENVDIIGENTKLGIEKVSLDFFNNNMFLFIKSIFDDNLLSMYELEYNLSTKLNINYNRFINMTPNESKIFINFYKKEKKMEEEAQKKANYFAK